VEFARHAGGGTSVRLAKRRARSAEEVV